MAEESQADRITMASGVNTSGKPFIHYTWVGQVRTTQWTPEEARIHGLALIECAEAAEHDAAVFNMLRSELELEPEQAAAFVAQLRNHRTKRDGDDVT